MALKAVLLCLCVGISSITCTHFAILLKGFNGCVHYKNGTNTQWNTTKNLKVEFFVPFNWEISGSTDILTMETDDLELVLLHPGKNYTSSLNAKNITNIALLSTAYVKLGWNEIYLEINRTLSNLTVKDLDGNIWLETMNNVQKGSQINVFVKGLVSFVNCDKGIKTYLISRSWKNIRIPIIFHERGTVIYFKSISLTDDYKIGVTFGRKFKYICRYNRYDALSVMEDCDPKLNFTNTLKRDIINYPLFFNISLYDSEDYLTIGDFTFTDILIHSLGSGDFVAQIYDNYEVNVFYEDIFPPLQMQEEKNLGIRTDYKSLFIFVTITLVLLVTFGAGIVFYFKPYKKFGKKRQEIKVLMTDDDDDENYLRGYINRKPEVNEEYFYETEYQSDTASITNDGNRNAEKENQVATSSATTEKNHNEEKETQLATSAATTEKNHNEEKETELVTSAATDEKNYNEEEDSLVTEKNHNEEKETQLAISSATTEIYSVKEKESQLANSLDTSEKNYNEEKEDQVATGVEDEIKQCIDITEDGVCVTFSNTTND